jgi:signal peptidase II
MAIIAVVVAVLDQLTKWLVANSISLGEVVPVIDGYFQLVNWRNTGAAWGMFSDYNIVLAAISVLTILALYLFRHSLGVHRLGPSIALGLITGGIIGNAIDRVRLHAVVDFLDFYFVKQVAVEGELRRMEHHWPAFNVADSAICVGVVIYLIASWRPEKDPSSTTQSA